VDIWCNGMAQKLDTARSEHIVFKDFPNAKHLSSISTVRKVDDQPSKWGNGTLQRMASIGCYQLE